MKLVIDPQHVGECTMVIGRVELPLTREQVVQMLYGDEFDIVRRTTTSPRRKQKAAKEEKPKRRSPAAVSLREKTYDVIAKIGPTTIGEIRAELLKRHPDVRKQIDGQQLSGILNKGFNVGDIRRTGTTGSFKYTMSKKWSAARSAEPVLNGAAPSAEATA